MAKTRIEDPQTEEPAAPQTVRVAYRAGPPEIWFAGRRWLRDMPQEVAAAEWAAMQARPDCAHFDFAPASA